MTDTAIPYPGMLATVRNRMGVVSAVDPFDGEVGSQRIHLVHIDYKDTQSPTSERIIWELEIERSLVEPTKLPDATKGGAMPPEDFDALLRAARWTALSPYLDPDGEGVLDRQPISSPFHGGVRVEDYQLVPLLKALRMPRVNLLIADDVGLGKTVEAGLILTELLLRRRIRRILVLTPASLRRQWRDELWDKFSLRFEVTDRHSTEQLRRKLGMDANPWRSFDHIVASYHYLRQPDVRDQFLAACQTPEGSPHLPWDLLIVDECHNLMPASFGKDSDLCETLGLIAPRFEHRIFLSATPHNGHTRSFTGLLEMLDPVSFSRVNEITPAMQGRVNDTVIRRLKRDINESSSEPRFCTRHPPKSILLKPTPLEDDLSEAFDAFRTALFQLAGRGSKGRRRAGVFAVEILGKRLLSCPFAFAESWSRARQGFAEEDTATEKDLAAAERSVRQETGDDRETHQRETTATTVVGAWLKNFADQVKSEIADIEKALEALGFDLDAPIEEQVPQVDARVDALIGLIEELLLNGGEFHDDERLIIFTEYKTTLDYLARRLREHYPSNRVLTLFGTGGAEGMDDAVREGVKNAFNDPNAGVRILIATDAASEGLNLHQTARYLMHFDCPWNPARLEQRNGRLDRYGQARDVAVHHFMSESNPDLRFLAHVIGKANDMREDLGSANEVFDHAVHRRLIQGEDTTSVRKELDRTLNTIKGERSAEGDKDGGSQARDEANIEALAQEIDLNDATLSDTLEAAMNTSGGTRPYLEASEDPSFYRIRNPGLTGWGDVIDDSVRSPVTNGSQGPMRQIAFSIEPFMNRLGPLKVYQPRNDATLIHLAHPLMQRALGILARHRYPGDNPVSRWTVRRTIGDMPKNADVLILLSFEELAVNDLRETFHRWVRTVAFPVRDGKIGDPLPHFPATEFQSTNPVVGDDERERAGEVLEDVNGDLQHWIKEYRKQLTDQLSEQLNQDQKTARERERKRYDQRQGELSSLIEGNTIRKLEREIEDLEAQARQKSLFEDEETLTELKRSIEEKEAEIKRRAEHYEAIREQLRLERERILNRLIPNRFSMANEAQVFPITLEVRLPERRA